MTQIQVGYKWDASGEDIAPKKPKRLASGNCACFQSKMALSTMLPILSCLFALGLSQFVPAPTDLTSTTGYYGVPVRYKKVPEGICELTPGVQSYSGYVDISPAAHIFFWFFEARNQDPTTAPLTVWINGGPGSSSMIGLFQEQGPCRIDEDYNVISNPYAWNNASNMIFIDQPSTVGLSYSEPVPAYYSDILGGSFESIVQLPDTSCPSYAHECGTYPAVLVQDVTNSTQSSADNFWKVMQGFMGAFPQYSRDSFHFTTESYGGHYGPVYNEYFLNQNAKIAKGQLSSAHKIDLKSVMVGNGWYDPLVQYQAYYNYTVYPGNTYDYSPFSKQIQNKMYNALYGPGNCYDQTMACYRTKLNDVCSNSDNFCAYEVEEILDIHADRDEYDIREFGADPFPPEYYVSYLNTPKVQQAIGAFTNFTEYSDTVGNAFGTTGDDDRKQSAPVDVGKLVDAGIYFAMYNGDADYNCNWLGNQVVADNIGATGWSGAGFENISTPDGVWHGQVKQSANFAFARIFESGHEVPFYQPQVALSMFERVINGYDIATGKTQVSKGGSYTSSGPSASTYREGNSTIQFKPVPANATYNTTTNEPNPPKSSRRRRRGLSRPLPIRRMR